MGIVIEPGYPQKICPTVDPTVDEASELLFSRGDDRITAQNIARAVRQLRE